jgi:hypothetical protein
MAFSNGFGISEAGGGGSGIGVGFGVGGGGLGLPPPLLPPPPGEGGAFVQLGTLMSISVFTPPIETVALVDLVETVT